MVVDLIKLNGFRNYQDVQVELSPGINVFYGENAQGKTNLLEAVKYLSCARSFRAQKERDMIAFGSDSAVISGHILHDDRDFLVEARLFTASRRQLFINGIKQKSASCLSGILNTVTFLPDDLYLVREGASVRRKFLDSALCQLRPRYLTALTEYNRLYEHKTRLLRDLKEKPSHLETLDVFSVSAWRISGQCIIRLQKHFFLRKARPAGETARTHDISGGRDRTGAWLQDRFRGIDDPSMHRRRSFRTGPV